MVVVGGYIGYKYEEGSALMLKKLNKERVARGWSPITREEITVWED